MSTAALAERTSVLERVADVVLVGFLIEFVLISQTVLAVTYSPTRATYLFYVIAVMALFGRFWQSAPRAVTASICVLAAMVLSGQVFWTVQYDATQANNYWQDWRIAVAVLAFGAAFGRRRWPAWSRVVVWCGLGVVGLQVIGLMVGPVSSDGGGADLFYRYRPISAQSALVMLAAFVLILTRERTPSVSVRVAAIVLGVSIVVSQHRSAWVALFIALCLLTLSYRRHRMAQPSYWPLAAVAGFWCLAILLPAFAGRSILPGAEEKGASGGIALPASAVSSGSFEWRLEMWRSRLQVSRSLSDVLFGGAFGPTRALGPDATVMNPFNSAHNLILDQFIMLGALGLLCIGLLLVIALAVGDHISGLQIVLWSSLGFGVFYNWPTFVWLLLGVGCVIGAARGVGIPTMVNRRRDPTNDRV